MLLPETRVGGVFDPVKSNLCVALPGCPVIAKISDGQCQDINKFRTLDGGEVRPKVSVFKHLTQPSSELHASGRSKEEIRGFHW